MRPRGLYMRLSELETGIAAKVMKFGLLEDADVQRLRQLGLNVGSTVEVISNNTNGPLLLKIGDARLAANREVCSQVKVIVAQ